MSISYRQEVYRKLIHLSSMWMPVAMYYLPVMVSAAVFLFLCCGNLLLEYGHYRKWQICYPVYEFCFGKMLRNAKPCGTFELSGSPYVLASAFLTVILFPGQYAVCAFSVMLLGDTAAALVGRKFGKTIFANGKSLEGFIAFIAASAIVVLVCAMIFNYAAVVICGACIGIILASLAELFEKNIHVDDNFSIPLITGACLLLSSLL